MTGSWQRSEPATPSCAGDDTPRAASSPVSKRTDLLIDPSGDGLRMFNNPSCAHKVFAEGMARKLAEMAEPDRKMVNLATDLARLGPGARATGIHDWGTCSVHKVVRLCSSLRPDGCGGRCCEHGDPDQACTEIDLLNLESVPLGSTALDGADKETIVEPLAADDVVTPRDPKKPDDGNDASKPDSPVSPLSRSQLIPERLLPFQEAVSAFSKDNDEESKKLAKWDDKPHSWSKRRSELPKIEEDETRSYTRIKTTVEMSSEDFPTFKGELRDKHNYFRHGDSYVRESQHFTHVAASRCANQNWF